MKTQILTILTLSIASALSLSASTDSHVAAANELLEIINPKESFEQAFMTTFEMSLDQMAKNGVPQDKVTQIRDAAAELARTVAEDPEMTSRMASIYIEIFTEAEIKELLVFYKTPVGKKTIETMPEVFQKGATIGQELTEKHMADFQAKMMAILSDK